MQNRPINLPIAVIISAIITCISDGPAAGQELPFQPGEKMTFEVRWSGILAGEAVIELLPVEDLNGLDSYHFVFTAKTSPFVDVFYKVRDRIDSYTDTGMTHSLLYTKRKEGRSKKEIIVQFDWDKLEARYSFNGEAIEPISIISGTFDPLSIFYLFRLHDLNNESEYDFPLTDGKKMITGNAKIIKRETIKVAGVSYDTFLVEPGMEDIGGVFEKSGNAKIQIWVTADDRRIPVRIKSKVSCGGFVADLVSFEHGLTAPTLTEYSPSTLARR